MGTTPPPCPPSPHPTMVVPGICSTLRRIISIAAPMAVGNIANHCVVPAVSLALVAQRNGATKVEVAAFGLGNVYVNALGLSVIEGLASAIITFAAPKFGGGQFADVGVIGQRAFLITSVASILLSTSWVLAAPILSALGQNDQVCSLVEAFILLRLPGIPCVVLQTVLTYLTYSTEAAKGAMWVRFAGCGFGVLTAYLTILSMGLKGAAIAATVQNAVCAVGMLIACVNTPSIRKCWGGWSCDAMTGWLAYLRIAAPGTLIVCVEWWSWEISTFLCGYISVSALGAQTTMTNVMMFAAPLFYAWGRGGGVLIGNALGECKPDTVKQVALAGTLTALLGAAVVCVVMYLLFDEILEIFVHNSDILAACNTVPFLFALVQLFQLAQTFLARTLEACGWQASGSLVLMVAMWVIALPGGGVLALVAKMQLPGMWWGLLSGSVIQVVAYFVLVYWAIWRGENEVGYNEAEMQPPPRKREAEVQPRSGNHYGTMERSMCSAEASGLALGPLDEHTFVE